MSYPIGARFEYKSKYSDDIIIGYIKEVGVETIADFRERKLKQIGL